MGDGRGAYTDLVGKSEGKRPLGRTRGRLTPMVLFLIIQGYTYLPTYLLIYSMVLSPSWEANWFAASQEISRISRNPNVHYRTHKRPPPVPILGQPNPIHLPTSHLLEIHLISSPFVFWAMPPLETPPPPPPQSSEWGSSLPPDCSVSTESI